ncbi:MAG: hypothetical protein QXM52_06840 [Candidatus Bathyarchaeia archaeon]
MPSINFLNGVLLVIVGLAAGLIGELSVRRLQHNAAYTTSVVRFSLWRITTVTLFITIVKVS